MWCLTLSAVKRSAIFTFNFITDITWCFSRGHDLMVGRRDDFWVYVLLDYLDTLILYCIRMTRPAASGLPPRT